MASGDWNPGATDVLGCEWPVTVASARVLDAASKLGASRFTSSGAEAVDQAEFYLSAVAGTPTLFAEIFNAGNEVCGDKTTTRYFPGTDAGATTTNMEDQAAGAVNFGDIDDDTVPPVTYAVGDGSGLLGVLLFRGNDAALVTKRILKVEMRGLIQTNLGAVIPRLNIGGTDYDAESKALNTGSSPVEQSLATWTINPATSEPWTLADINALIAVAGTDEFGMLVDAFTASGTRIYGYWLDVTYVDENRVAYGTLTSPAVGWNAVLLEEPDGTDNWPKAAASQAYTVTLRRITDSGSASWRTLDSLDACPNAAHASYQPSADGDGCITALGDARTAAHSIILVTTAPADSDDSQAYALLFATPVYTGSGANEQEFSGAAVDDYDRVAAVIRNPNDADATLDIKIRRRADNVQFGSTVSIASADIGDDWTSVLEALGVAATLAAATQYYIEFTSAASSVTGWEVTYLATGNNGNGTTYNGTTDRGTLLGIDSDSVDYGGALAAAAPDAPADWAGSLGTHTLTPVAPGCIDVTSVAYADLTWTATALGADFDYYEIQRSEDGGTTWTKIAHITDEAVEQFLDYEGLRGVEASYRLRVVNIYGIFSDWTTTSVTVTATVFDCEWVLTTNEQPSLTVAYNRDPEHAYEFIDASEVVDRRFYGRDYQVGFRPLERRGVRFDLPVAINFADVPTSPGIAVWQPLRDLVTAALSYVCVLDPDGNRFYASVKMPEGLREEPAAAYTAVLTVVEVTDTSTTPDVT